MSKHNIEHNRGQFFCFSLATGGNAGYVTFTYSSVKVTYLQEAFSESICHNMMSSCDAWLCSRLWNKLNYLYLNSQCFFSQNSWLTHGQYWSKRYSPVDYKLVKPSSFCQRKPAYITTHCKEPAESNVFDFIALFSWVHLLKCYICLSLPFTE